MTTITTGTSGPQAWKMILAGAAVGLATIAIVNLPQTTSDTTGQHATDASQAVTAESPQTRSFFEENSATGRTPGLSDSVAGFEYNNESTAGQAASPGVTSQYLGNSGELFPYENGSAPVQAPTGFGGPMPQATLNQAEINRLAPVITQEFLDGPSSATQGAVRVDPRVAVAAGLNPGAIDAIVGGTARVAVTPDNLADRQDRATASQTSSAPSFAASDEALVNPVPEVNAAQLIEDIIASERSAPAYALAASDEALVSGVGEPTFNSAPYVAYAEGMSEASFDGAPYVAYAEGMSEATPSGTVDWDGLGGPYQDGTAADYYAQEIAQRSPQQNVSMR